LAGKGLPETDSQPVWPSGFRWPSPSKPAFCRLECFAKVFQNQYLAQLNSKPFSDPEVPKAVVSRLSLYLRELQQLLRVGIETISSSKLGRRLGVTDAQVRKDFAYFGQFGYPGIGYRCEELILQIRKILGTDKTWPVALIGCGNLGQALLGYHGFGKQGFKVEVALDIDPQIVGQTFEGLKVEHLDTCQSRYHRNSEFCSSHINCAENGKRSWGRFGDGVGATCLCSCQTSRKIAAQSTQVGLILVRGISQVPIPRKLA